MAKRGGQKAIFQQLELPHKENGEVDWETLGNILTGRILGEVLHASYLDPKYGITTDTFPADTEWRYVSEEREIVILKKRLSPDSPLWCFMGRGVIDQPIQKVADFFRTPLSTHALNPFVDERRVVEILSNTRTTADYIGYVTNEAKRCFVKAKRDFVYYMHYVEKDEKCIKTVLSIEHRDCPPVPGITRGQFRPGSGWVIERYKGDEHRTLVSVLAHLDLIGLQPVIANLILKRLPLQIYHLKKHLMKPLPASNYRYEMTESLPTFSGRHFEDPISIGIFTGRELQPSRNLHPARDFPKRNLEVGTDNAGQISATEDVHVPYKPETDEEQVEPPADLKEPQQGDCSITAT